MAKLTPYLFFDGNCREAMNFYHDCLGGELKMQTVAESGAAAHMPKDAGPLIMHSTLDKGSLSLMASDMMDSKSTRGNNMSLTLVCESEAEIKSFFDKLSQGGKVTSPLKTEFWGGTFGQLVDKYGFMWMLNFGGQNI
jgi:PhnB protein